MKTKLLLIILLLGVHGLHAQGTFRNLDFEGTLLPYSTNAGFLANSTDAFPGWIAYRGSEIQPQVAYNGSTFPLSVSLWASGFLSLPPTPPSFGSFSAVFAASDTDPLLMSLGQTGTIPLGVNVLTFETFGFFHAGSLQISFGTNILPLAFTPGPGSLNGTWTADLTGLAGLTDELRITAIPQPDVPGRTRLDNLQFLAVPEPGVWALLALGGALGWGLVRRRKS